MTGFPPFWAAYQAWRPEFAKAIDETLHPLDWLDGEVWSGKYRIDHTEDAAILSAYKIYPSGAFDIEGIIAAGNPNTIVNSLIPTAVARAKADGAVGAIIQSREGWAKLLKPQGFEPYQLSIRKVL